MYDAVLLCSRKTGTGHVLLFLQAKPAEIRLFAAWLSLW
jgi:hypothetical protein